MYLLIIEDNPDLVENVTEFLESKGHDVDIAYNGPAGLGFAIENSYDVIIMDLMLPGMDGLEICTRLRKEGNDVPVLMLTARDTLENKLEGFASGADDYLIKPFALPELEVRIAALARRGQSQSFQQRLVVSDLLIDLNTMHVERAGRRIELPPIPLKILMLLMRRSPGVVSHTEIEREIWGSDPPDSDTLRAHLHTLRNAIDRDFSHALLCNVRGIGYRIAVCDES